MGQKTKHDSSLLLAVLGVLAVPLVFWLQGDGIVTISWLTSLCIYLAIIAALILTYSRWNKPETWRRWLRILISTISLIFLVWLSAEAVMSAYRRELNTRSGKASSETASLDPGRHLTEKQSDAIRRTLLFSPTLKKIAIVTLMDKPERLAYANELADAFQQSGVSVPRLDIDYVRFHQSAGLSLIRHSQENMPDLRPLIAVLVAAQIPYRIVDIGNPQGAGFYIGEIDTSTPVVFVGPRINPPSLIGCG